jgi:hypothetical protein
MDQLQYGKFAVDSEPVGRLAQRVRDSATLGPRFSAEQARMLDEVWDVDALHARIDRAVAALHSTARTDSRTLRDIARFDARVEHVKSSIANRKP